MDPRLSRSLDITEQISALTGELAESRELAIRLATERDTARAQSQAITGTMTTGESELRTQLAAITIERDALRTEVQTLTANQEDFESRVRARIMELGIRPTAIKFPTFEQEGQPKAEAKSDYQRGVNLTEQMKAWRDAHPEYKGPQP